MSKREIEIDYDDICFMNAIAEKLDEEERNTLFHIISKINWLAGWRVGAMETMDVMRGKGDGE